MSARGRDTIAAVATPPGAGGVGIVRVSGAEAGTILTALTGRTLAAFEPRRLVLCRVREPQSGGTLDQVLAVYMPAPHTFTGEDVVEVHGHGGVLNMSRLLGACLSAGARLAEPGEFTRRAFENGRLDLTQVEAVAAVIGAGSERALRAAQAQLAGALGAKVESLRATVVSISADVEAAIDFPEAGFEFPTLTAVLARVEAVRAEVAALGASYGAGRALREGVTVALVGVPNVGKSSLLNALVGEERALVAAEPGTTRDYLEAQVVWDGVPVTLVDTAGEREAEGAVERRGVALGRARAAQADVIVRVVDAAAPQIDDVGTSLGTDGEPALTAWNKIDVAPAPPGAIGVSALSGAGLGELRRAVIARALGGAEDGAEGELVATQRQRALLGGSERALAAAAAAIVAQQPLELIAADLAAAAAELGRIHGVDVGDEVMASVFARFCIGK